MGGLVALCEEGVGELTGCKGYPGGVGDIGTLPDSFSRWEDEQPKLNGWSDGSPTYAG